MPTQTRLAGRASAAGSAAMPDSGLHKGLGQAASRDQRGRPVPDRVHQRSRRLDGPCQPRPWQGA